MPDKRQTVYKTEEQIKQEAAIRRENEAKLAAARPKSTAELKRENYWYHYKWHTIIGAVVLLLAVFFVKDIFFRTNPDATIIMISEKYFAEESIGFISKDIERFADDYNGDKKILINIDFIMLPGNGEDPGASQMDYANTMKLSAILAAASDPVYLLDEAAYRYITGMGTGEDDAPGTDNIFEAESVPVNLPGQPEFSGMRFYLRQSSGKNVEYYKYCEELLKKIDRG